MLVKTIKKAKKYIFIIGYYKYKFSLIKLYDSSKSIIIVISKHLFSSKYLRYGKSL